MKPQTIAHEAIAASAGSGKTYQLAHRYIRLMANDVAPDRIIALTFSRKAAGEIFDSIVARLLDAIASPGQRARTAALIRKEDFGEAEFLRTLRTFLDNLHRLHVGTLDSFIISVIRAFPAELGLAMDMQVMDSDGAAAEELRTEVLAGIFDPRGARKHDLRALLEAYKQATFGQEEKGESRFDTFIAHYRDTYLLQPDARAWGQESIVWPEGSPWLNRPRDPQAAADKLTALLSRAGYPPALADKLLRIARAAARYDERTQWPEEIEGVVLERLLAQAEDLRKGHGSIDYQRRSYQLDPEACPLIHELLLSLVGTEIRRAIEQTRGIHRVLAQYEAAYDELMRRTGRLTFTDAQYLLTGSNEHSGGALLSRNVDADRRLYIDYRLDCQLDHWLLDEFQDTSNLQWAVLRNLVDEVVQDDSGRRTFFYVGDVKQAIYRWRGGNAGLFQDILDAYGARIESRPLNTSYRSCQPVIDTVNAVFDELHVPDLPSGAADAWRAVWQTHTCEAGVVPADGFTALLEPPTDGKAKPVAEDRYRLAARILKQIDPLRRGLAAALLVRTNKQGKSLVDVLRRECPGWAIVHEGNASINDNPVVAVLLSLVQFAAHPGDTFAWRHLQMSPLRGVLCAEPSARSAQPLILLRQIQAYGFQEFLRRWGDRLDELGALDDFGRKRFEDLLGAAAEFDAGGSRDCGAFVRFASAHQVRELAAEDAVRVMTVHQAKGLGFDVVILPDLMSDSLTRGRDVDLVESRLPGASEPQWILKMPRRRAAEQDPVLAPMLAHCDETSSFDELCVLYVALTRAKRALYMITSFPGPNSKALTSASFLKQRLCKDPLPTSGPQIRIGDDSYTCLYEAGSRDWYQAVMPAGRTAGATPPRIPKSFHRKKSLRERLTRVSPSLQAEGDQPAADLFGSAGRDTRDFGTAIHELFEHVAWMDETNIEEAVRAWRARGARDPNVTDAVEAQFRSALASGEFAAALRRPAGRAEAWLERSFEAVIGGEWISGTFDRVVVIADASGRATGAWVQDYKSNRIESDADLADKAEHYRPQLELYRQVLSSMLALKSDRIRMQLLFTQPGRVFELTTEARSPRSSEA